MFRHPYLLLTLTSLFWSGNYVLSRAMHADIPPVTLSFWRWAIALAVLLPFVVKPVKEQWPLMLAQWRRVALLGLLGVTGFNTLVYLGVQYTTATNALLLNSFIPVFTVLITWLFMKQHLAGRQLFGVFVSLSGVFVILSRADLATLQALDFNQGDLLVFLAALIWALYTVIVKGMDPAVNRFGLLAVITVIGLLGIAPFYAWELALGYTVALNPANLASFFYVGIFPSVLAFLFYNYGVAQVGPERASLFIHLMPVFGTLMSVAFLGESFELFHAVGISGIFAGIYLTTRPSKAAG